MQTALLDLKILLQNGVILLDIPANELATISRKLFDRKKNELKKSNYFFLF